VRSYKSIICILILSACINLACSSGNNGAGSIMAAEQYFGKPQSLSEGKAVLAGQQLAVMLARSNNEKAQGLMFFDKLANDKGMLFIYNSPRIMSFWMKNTRIPLDLVFFNADLAISGWIEGMQPGIGIADHFLPRYTSNEPAQYALELNHGSVASMGLKLGDRLEIPLTLLYSND
jgi:uncharacterized membrane protein (UPF0127 family)